MRKVYALLFLCFVSCIRTMKNGSNKPKKGIIKIAKQKFKRYTKRYRKSLDLKEEHVLGKYEVKAYFNFDDNFERLFKWKLYYNFCKSRSPSICNYMKLRKEFQKMYDEDTFSLKRYMSDVNIIFSHFVNKYSILQFDVKLDHNNVAIVSKTPKISDILMESFSNFVSRKKLQYPTKEPSWRLSFNYATGVKKLIVSIPSQVPGLTFTFYFVIIAFQYCKSSFTTLNCLEALEIYISSSHFHFENTKLDISPWKKCNNKMDFPHQLVLSLYVILLSEINHKVFSCIYDAFRIFIREE
ncbi:hypothetical protein POVCU1_030450 [Plasmodium ovale curtisi]|uniref:Uncharacterized protein n=1 Tax=Plasmodium ovale curtisi TaxID=864141 RepID=A0A1A8WXB0_PLAOA|nr:hypothetical protein POVCU1_030450 [Plasmodium ovale curtisi]